MFFQVSVYTHACAHACTHTHACADANPTGPAPLLGRVWGLSWPPGLQTPVASGAVGWPLPRVPRKRGARRRASGSLLPGPRCSSAGRGAGLPPGHCPSRTPRLPPNTEGAPSPPLNGWAGTAAICSRSRDSCHREKGVMTHPLGRMARLSHPWASPSGETDSSSFEHVRLHRGEPGPGPTGAGRAAPRPGGPRAEPWWPCQEALHLSRSALRLKPGVPGS